MLLPLHIVIALVSIGYATLTWLWPSQRKLRIATTLIAFTIGSGTYLAWTTHARILSVCLTGLLYVSGMLALMLLARSRLAHKTTILSS